VVRTQLSHACGGNGVDLTSERIYVSRPLFWQATRLLDGSESSKTIEFLRPSEEVDPDKFVRAVTRATALLPGVPDVLYSLTTAFRRLPQFLELRVDANHYDAWCAFDEAVLFRDFLEVCAILLGSHKDLPLAEADRPGAFSFEYWARKSDQYGMELTWLGAREPLHKLLPVLIARLGEYRDMVIAGSYYWSYKNPQFLAMVLNASLPLATDQKTLDDCGYRYDEMKSSATHSISYVVSEARAKVNGSPQVADPAPEGRSRQTSPMDSSTSESPATATAGDTPGGGS